MKVLEIITLSKGPVFFFHDCLCDIVSTKALCCNILLQFFHTKYLYKYSTCTNCI